MTHMPKLVMRRVAATSAAAVAATGLLVLLPVFGGVAEEPAPVTPNAQEIVIGEPDAPAGGVQVAPVDPSAQVESSEKPSTESLPQGESTSSATSPDPASPSSAVPSASSPAAPSSSQSSGSTASPTDSATTESATPEVPSVMPTPPGTVSLTLDKQQTSVFAAAGVSWLGAAPEDGIAVQIRVQAPGSDSWGEWTTLGINRDTAPNPDAPQQRQGSDPYWFGSSDAVEIAVTVAPGTDVSDIKLTLIDPKKVVADSNSSAEAPTSSAGAAAGDRPAIYTRADWGADESQSSWAPSYSPTVKAATLHHSADGNNYTASDVPALMRSIYYYQSVTLGWGDIGYNVVVDKFGRAWEGRKGGIDSAVIGAHAGGFNRFTFGVSMLGNYESVGVPDVVTEKIAQLIAWKFNIFGVNPQGTTELTQYGGAGTTAKFTDGTTVTLSTIFGHKDVGRTACPGVYGYSLLPYLRARAAAIMTTLAKPPTASLDYLTISDRSVVASGWAFDPDSPAAPVTVRVTRDGAALPEVKTTVPRPDVNATFGVTGTHGFYASSPDQPLGSHTYCVKAVDVQGQADRDLGCKTLEVGRAPNGVVDYVVANGTTVSLSGWAFDLDSPALNVSIAVVRDGTWLGNFSAETSRPDVNAVYGLTGGHGYYVALPNQPGGSHSYCISVYDPQGGPSVPLGCRAVGVGVPPTGVVDTVSAAGSSVYVAGWAFDKDSPSLSITVGVTRDGVPLPLRSAAGARPDVNAAYGITGGHGYGLNLSGEPRGTHSYCVNAYDPQGGPTVSLGCRSVTVTASPQAVIDAITVSGSTVKVQGWAFDADSPALSVTVGATRNGVPLSDWSADYGRPDVNAVYGLTGNHGLMASYPSQPKGTAQYCFWVYDPQGQANSSLGCKSVTV